MMSASPLSDRVTDLGEYLELTLALASNISSPQTILSRARTSTPSSQAHARTTTPLQHLAIMPKKKTKTTWKPMSLDSSADAETKTRHPANTTTGSARAPDCWNGRPGFFGMLSRPAAAASSASSSTTSIAYLERQVASLESSIDQAAIDIKAERYVHAFTDVIAGVREALLELVNNTRRTNKHKVYNFFGSATQAEKEAAAVEFFGVDGNHHWKICHDLADELNDTKHTTMTRLTAYDRLRWIEQSSTRASIAPTLRLVLQLTM